MYSHFFQLNEVDQILPGFVYIIVVILGMANFVQSFLFLVETKVSPPTIYQKFSEGHLELDDL